MRRKRALPPSTNGVGKMKPSREMERGETRSHRAPEPLPAGWGLTNRTNGAPAKGGGSTVGSGKICRSGVDLDNDFHKLV